MLTARPEIAGAEHACRTPRATSVTYVKSRVCSPSPYMVGARPPSSAEMKSEMTPEYCDSGDCRGPNTLKNRSATVSRP